MQKKDQLTKVELGFSEDKLEVHSNSTKVLIESTRLIRSVFDIGMKFSRL